MTKKLILRAVALVACLLCTMGAAAAEAYACYTPSNTTLTFYYDNLRSSRTGTTYDLNTGSQYTDWDTDGTKASVTKVVFDPSFANARPTTTFDWFYGMQNLQSITGISNLNTSEVTNMSLMFQNCTQLTSLDLSHFNTSKVTVMTAMFGSCWSLTSLDLGSFNTSKVTNMGWMFNQCSNLRTVYVGNGWSTAAVTSSTNMFSGCTSLVGGQGTTYNASNPKDKTYAHIDGGTSNPGYFTAAPEAYACYTPSNTTLTFYYDNQRASRSGTTYDLNTGTTDVAWDTDGTNASVTKVVFDSSFAGARPTTTYDWFYDMTNLQSITGLSYLNTSEVTNMAWMFGYCAGLTSLDLSHFNTSKVTNMGEMFYGCSSLTSLDLSSFNTAKVTKTSYMFGDCSNLRTIYVGNDWSTAAVTNSTDMFLNCSSLVGGQGTTYDANHIDKTYAHIDGGTSNPGYFTEFKEAYACYTPSNMTLTFYYDNQRSSRPGTTYDLNSGSNDPGWYTDGTYSNVTKVVFNSSFASARPTTTYYWFGDMSKLQSITGTQYFNTSQVTNMCLMFAGAGAMMPNLNANFLNTSNVKTMESMFANSEFTSIIVSDWNTSEVTNMLEMFAFCYNLTSLDLSNFNTSKVTTMEGMFNEDYILVSLDLSNWNTSNVTNMNNMFHECNALTSVDLSSFNTAKVTTMYSMFDYCTSLTSLDLSSFNTSKVTDMRWMFSSCSKLTTIYAGSGWSTAATTDSNSDGMFRECTKIRGGQGTTYNANHVDKTYAHIDGGPSNPGYFTAASEPYACYTESNTTLTFYYDNQRSSRTGTTYDLNTGTTNPDWNTDGTYADVTKVVFDPSFAAFRPTTTYDWFYYMANLQSITGMSNLNTSEVTNMAFMFYGCNQLTSIDLSHFNTSQVTDMSVMFYGCIGLTSLDLGSFNTSQVTNMTHMFRHSNNLRTIYVGDGWSTAAVTNSATMFYNCTSLVGGQGTTYDADHVNAEYAHIDGGPSNPGYFTAKSAFLLGDVNGDGHVNITDVTALIAAVLNDNLSGIIVANSDMNGDGNINITDVTALISLVLNS